VDLATIAAILRPFARLSPEQLDQTSIYLDLLLKWNARINLTAVRSPQEIVTRHFGESFFVASRLLPATESISVIDLGSGAGFPGLPLAMFAPSASVTLIESNTKKAAFLNEVIAMLKLKNVVALRQRGEDCSQTARLVTMRAVEDFGRALPIALRLVEPAGRIALMIGAGQVALAKSIVPEVVWAEPVPVPESHARVLLVSSSLRIAEAKPTADPRG
jgi:16S rRNA (guanine527-N7)-methyltransferase